MIVLPSGEKYPSPAFTKPNVRRRTWERNLGSTESPATESAAAFFGAPSGFFSSARIDEQSAATKTPHANPLFIIRRTRTDVSLYYYYEGVSRSLPRQVSI